MLSFLSRRTFMLIGALALALPFAAIARPPGGHDPAAKIERLGLDEVSQAQVDAILDGSRTEHRSLRRALRNSRQTLRDLMKDRSSDEAVLIAQVERVSQAELALHKYRIATHLQLRTVLSDDQLESLFERGKRRRHARLR